MPVSVRSRYWNQATIAVAGPDGPSTALPVRRTLAVPEGATVSHVVNALDGVESLAAQFYGRSDVWWRIADANPPRFPLDFVPGERIEMPQRIGIGRVVRTRGR